MTQRDELARLLNDTNHLGCGCCTNYNFTQEQDEHADKIEVGIRALVIADALLADGWTKPRTITTVEELDGLPVDSVVMSDTIAHQHYCGGNWAAGGRWYETSQIDLPATVLGEPTK